MRINKIVLYNFNSFERENEFDFSSTDADHNIILIGGRNGAGKTSLFTAIKIALYGPLAFGYVGINPHYIAKIKECINSKAFQKNTVQARVKLTISLMIEREIKEYEITREWDYSQQKLIENYSVTEGGNALDDKELSYFQNYLQSVIPPDLFEFFLFDGEEVGSIFSSSTYNTYVKNAIYTLCGLDMFEIIRKYTGGYIGKAANANEEEAYRQYEECKDALESAMKEKAEIETVINQKVSGYDDISTSLTELETSFKRSGGITETERKKLAKESEEAERAKTEAVTKIKYFVEGMMPFFIINGLSGTIKEQIEAESEGENFEYIRKKINKTTIGKALKKSNVSDSDINLLVEALLDSLKPKGYKEGTKTVYDLSKEEINRVLAIISNVETFDVQAMVGVVNSRKQAADRTAEINRILKSAMTDEDVAVFASKENALLRQKEEVSKILYEYKHRQEEIETKVAELKHQEDHAFQVVKDSAQNKHVFELSAGLSNMMTTVLTERFASIKQKLEKLIVENLQKIYRKNNLITHIEIGDDFQFNLYQDAYYSSEELMYLMKNLGKDAFLMTIGNRGLAILNEKFGTENISQLHKKLAASNFDDPFRLFKRIDLSRLSKGERQIFILSLYWAIIEISGKDIPFVIDTPYARIDADHRKGISEKFFPNISKQVIILSTDEEINEEFYAILKPYIAKEYLLTNDESQNRTTIEQHYFFGA